MFNRKTIIFISIMTFVAFFVMNSCSKKAAGPEDDIPPNYVLVKSFGGHPVKVTDSILITFSEPILASTCNNSSISIGEEVPLAINCRGDSIICTPLNRLEYETTYNLTISSEVSDLHGNTLDSAYTFHFTTESPPAGTDWTLRFDDVHDFQDVAYSDSIYVAVGWDGAIARSENGYYWYIVDSPTERRMRQIIWADTMFIAVADGPHVVVSPDGKDWTLYSLPQNTWPFDIAFSGSTYVVVDCWGKICTSSDAMTWQVSHSISYPPGLNGVVWAGDKFIVTGDDNLILQSADGYYWDEVNFENDLFYDFGDIAWSGEVIVALVTNYVGMVIISEDGQDWDIRHHSHLSSSWGIDWTGDMFIIGAGPIYTSTTGRNWTKNESVSGLGSCGTASFKVVVGNRIYTSQ